MEMTQIEDGDDEKWRWQWQRAKVEALLWMMNKISTFLQKVLHAFVRSLGHRFIAMAQGRRRKGSLAKIKEREGKALKEVENLL